MKLKVLSIVLTVIAVLMGVQTASYSQDGMTTAEYNKTTVYAFTGVTNITFNATSERLPRLASILVTYPTSGSNTFTFTYVRGAYTNTLINYTYNNQTFAAFFGSDIYFTAGDQLQFRSSAGGTAQLTLNWR